MSVETDVGLCKIVVARFVDSEKLPCTKTRATVPKRVRAGDPVLKWSDWRGKPVEVYVPGDPPTPRFARCGTRFAYVVAPEFLERAGLAAPRDGSDFCVCEHQITFDAPEVKS